MTDSISSGGNDIVFIAPDNKLKLVVFTLDKEMRINGILSTHISRHTIQRQLQGDH